ncbi:MAG: DUF4177 domain-containing protein [Thermodesulfobacteriota bacterium]
MLKYRVVELSTVTDEELEGAINGAVAEGWNFDGIQFAMREASKRPSMAFVIFTREEDKDET